MNVPEPRCYAFGDFRIDTAARQLSRRDGTPVALTSRVFETLLYLVRHPGVSLGKDELLAAIWPGRVIEENNLTQSISTLRKVLGGEVDGHRYIVTEPGRGYRFVAGVQAEAASGTDARSSAAVPLPDDLPAPVSIAPRTARHMSRALLIVLACALLVYFAFDKFVLAPRRESAMDVAAGHRKSGELDNGRSIAVLPFGNLSADAENAYFASGMENEILTRLSKIGALKVISRTSTQQYASKPSNVSEIAKQLGVANILEGSVQKAGDSVRINVQLIRADDDSHLWAETYDRKLDNIFGVESEVATAVADSLRAKLTGSEQRALAVKPTDNAAAYDAYLRGLALEVGGGSLDYFRRAAAAFTEAVRLDPRFALAWAHLADNRSGLYFNGADIAENTADAVKQAADTALRLQPELGEAWLAQGEYRYHVLRDFPGALQAFDEASKRLPNNAQVLEAIALVVRRMGRWDEALSMMQQAMQLDPRNMDILLELAQTFLLPMRRFAEARAVLDRGLLIAPDNAQVIARKARTYLNEGRFDEAAKLLDPLPLDPKDGAVFEAKADLLWAQGNFESLIAVASSVLPKPGEPLTDEQADMAVGLGYVQLHVGNAAAARSLFERVIHLLKPTPASIIRVDNRGRPMALASAYAGIGDEQAALEAARRAVESYRDDAMMKTIAEITLAQIQGWFGDNDAAITMLPHLLQAPNGLNPVDLQLDFRWGELRKDPRFQRLLADSEKSPGTKP